MFCQVTEWEELDIDCLILISGGFSQDIGLTEEEYFHFKNTNMSFVCLNIKFRQKTHPRRDEHSFY